MATQGSEGAGPGLPRQIDGGAERAALRAHRPGVIPELPFLRTLYDVSGRKNCAAQRNALRCGVL